MDQRIHVVRLGLFVLVLMATSSVEATLIPVSAFTPGATIESFEGVVTGNSSLIVGAPIVLPSGAVLQTQPGGNLHGIQDASRHTTGAYGSSPITPIPHGTAFLVGNTFPGYPIAFTFATDQHRVGANIAFTSNYTGNITLSVFNSSNLLLETVSIPSVNLPGWPTNFIGVQTAGGIRRAEFSSSHSVGTLLDQLRFEAVPEPGSATLLLIGLAAVGGMMRVRRRWCCAGHNRLSP